MESLKELKELGLALGYDGASLQDFIHDQQESQRAERQYSREAKRAEIENAKEQREHERELKRLADIEEEKKRAHEKMLAELDHDEKVKQIELQKAKELSALEFTRTVELSEAKLKQEDAEHRHKLELIETQARFPVAAPVPAPRTVSSRTPKLPYFEETVDDMDAYLQRFERYATSQSWPKDEWAVHLSALLKGKALDVYSRIAPHEAMKFDVLKEALLKRFEMTEDGFRKRFRNCRPELGETFMQFSTRLARYIDRWLDLSKTDKTFEGLLNLMLKDQFMQSCGKELRLFLRERIPKTIDEMSELADQFREARGGNIIPLINKSKRWDNSEKANSDAASAPVHQEMKPKDSVPKGKKDKRCFLCDKIGHFAYECKLKQKALAFEAAANSGSQQHSYDNSSYRGQSRGQGRGPYRGRGNRFNRGRGSGQAMAVQETDVKEGNVSHDNVGCSILSPTLTETAAIVSSACENQIFHPPRMPVSQGKVNGHVVTLLRDTGCSGVVIKRELVKDEQLNGKSQLCVLIDGTKLQAPVANVHIDTPYYTGNVEAWCMNNPVYDLILGNIEGARLPGEPDPHWNLTQAVQTRAQKKEESKPYSKLKVPDSLLTTATPEEIKLAQQADNTLGKVREVLKSGEEKISKGGGRSWFVNKNGLIYRKFKPSSDQDQATSQLVVPMKYRTTVLQLAHETLMAGHFSTKKTSSRILSEFWWPGCQADCGRFCKSCDMCQRTYPKGKVPKAPLGDMPLVDIPFQRIAVDIVGPLDPPSYKKNRYILTIVDYATRYPEAIPLPGIEAERVAEALVDVFSRVGVPREMLTDLGTQFTSELMHEVSRLLSIRQLTTTPYHPMCNGLVEKFNGTLKQMLKKMCSEQPKDWDKYINALLFAYREVPQDSLGFSPFEMLYGRSVRGPMAILKELWTQDVPDPEIKTTYQFVFDLKEKLEKTCQMAQENLKTSSARYKKYYNSKARDRQLKAGDKVLVLLPTSNNKLLMQWKGPFVVTRKMSPLDYKVDVYGKVKPFHINMLRLYTERLNTDEQKDSNVLAEVSVAIIDIDQEEEEQDRNNSESTEIPSLTQCEQKESFEDINLSRELCPEQGTEMKKILQEFPDVFTDLPGKTDLVECDIKLTSTDPVKVKQYPMPYSMTEEVKKEVQQMEKMGVIEHSESPYSFPIVMVKKKDGTNRCCIDFRQLNRITLFDAEPMPNAEEMFAKLAGHKYFSRLDLTKGYWQVPMSDKSKKLTAFSTPQGLFQFRTMPFGLVIAPAVFSRLMRKLLDNMDNIDNFIDDILVFTMTWPEHVDVLCELFRRLRCAGLTAKPSKTFIGYRSLECLGHLLGNDRLQPNPEKVIAVENADRPSTKKQVKAFIGLVGFYRKFIPNFSVIAAPLTDLMRKGQPTRVKWTEIQEHAFNSLKKALTMSPILKLPNVSEMFILRTDASDRGIGSVLLQEEVGVKWPVAYASRKLLPREESYATVEKECLALVWSIQKFQRYLYGKHFIVETDHQPLLYLNKAKVSNARLMRWALLLQPYRFTVHAIKGSENVGADYLSRQ